MKKCQKCKNEYSGENIKKFFTKNNSKKDGLSTECRPCRKRYQASYTALNRDTLNESKRISGKKRYQNARLMCIAHYSKGSMECECCKESNLEFLAVNHLHGGGNKERKTFKGARSFYEYLVKMGFPDHLNVLCHNCNMALGFYGYCPHQKEVYVKG
jgi:hypothetical protein